MNVTDAITILTWHPEGIAAAVREMPAVETPCNQRRIRGIEQSRSFGLSFDVRADVIVKYHFNTVRFKRPPQLVSPAGDGTPLLIVWPACRVNVARLLNASRIAAICDDQIVSSK